MMGHPDLVCEVENLEPLISPEGLEQLQNKYVHSVRVREPACLTVCLSACLSVCLSICLHV